MRNRSQCDRILAYLKDGKRITAEVSYHLFGCMRLAARIADLKKRGYNIGTTMRYEIDEDGNPVRYAVYYYEGDK